MQQFVPIAGTQTLTDSRTEILNNDRTIMSCSSGTAFPTTNMEVGMLCFRTDLNQVFELKNLTPTWVLIADLNKTYTNKEFVDAQIATRVPFSEIVTVPTANKILRLDANGNLPASITGNAVTATTATTALAVAWSGITGKPMTFIPPIATTTTIGGIIAGSGLSINSSGILSADIPATPSRGYRMFLYSGTFTVPEGVEEVWLSMCGGGGGGKQGHYVNEGDSHSGGGGGGAHAILAQNTAVTPGEVITITVGAGGNAGSAGGTSSFGPYVSCAGGGGATGTSDSGNAGGPGGSPGTIGELFGSVGTGGGCIFGQGSGKPTVNAGGFGAGGAGGGSGGAAGSKGSQGFVLIQW
ncbi:hypothetical protein EV210_106134 [Anaerospora hongkongensis]|uniref:Glycine-rich domain-containing protein n=1 Tax=Anaerospora hongkongensis TaxID=244830 RepID=A0A4R1Q1C2_9FIRM|nr:hypothetical protein [Anaerospora hongkongensis]TCL37265.1 hypothetical protein EV210_106134 [Anaerospora hongkongensis]